MNRTYLKELYDAYGYAVYSRCLRILGNPSDADDMVHDVFIRAFKYGDRFDGKNPLGWLYRISDRQCFDKIKRSKRMIPVEKPEEKTKIHYSDQSEMYRNAFSGYAVKQIVSNCHPKDARTALLYFVDEMTQDEIAEEMGCSRKTVGRRLMRFKEKARSLLDNKPDSGRKQ